MNLHPQDKLIASLVAASKAGSGYAYGRLVRMHQSQVRGFLKRLTAGNDLLADDLAQETFLKAFQKIADFEGRAKFSTWLRGIAYHLFIDHYRKDSRRSAMREQEETGLPQTCTSPDLKLDLAAAMKLLKPDERTAITLCLSEGFSHQEAADVMNIPIGTVKSHINRGREKLKPLLQGWQKSRIPA